MPVATVLGTAIAGTIAGLLIGAGYFFPIAYADEGGGPAGTVVTVTVTGHEMDELAGIQIHVGYDQAVAELVSVRTVGAAANFFMASKVRDELSVVSVVMASALGISGTGPIVELKFRLVGEQCSSTGVTLEKVDAFQLSGKSLSPLEIEPSQLSVTCGQPTPIPAVLTPALWSLAGLFLFLFLRVYRRNPARPGTSG